MSFIEKFRPENHTLLGEGVWGKVYDLGDGTVLKIAKEKGGAGSGREKIMHEIMVLKALETAEKPASFAWPALIASEDFPPGWIFKGDEYVRWLHSTKMVGVPLKIEEIESLSKDDQAKVTRSLAHTLIQFHDILRKPSVSTQLKEDPIFLSDEDTKAGLSEEDMARLEKVRSAIAEYTGGAPKPIHGDFNISNILFGSDRTVSGVLDFAETCLGYDEDDVCSLTSELPFLKHAIINEYEAKTGRSIDPIRMMLAEMKRDLISTIICRYKINKPEDARVAEKRLDRLIQGLHI